MPDILKIVKQRREVTAVKPCNVYVDTHEKLSVLSTESGISIVKLIAIFVDYGMANMELLEPPDNA